MPIKKLDDGRYMVDIRPLGRQGNRIRRTFNKKTEAIAFERHSMANAQKLSTRTDRRDLSDLLNLWWLYHGQTAENGTIEKRQLMKTIRQLNDPSINRLNKHVLLEHRSNRLADGIKASTINRDMYRLSGMITTLQKLEVFSGSNARSTPHIRKSFCDERWKHCCTATNTWSCQYTTNYGVCASSTRLSATCHYIKPS